MMVRTGKTTEDERGRLVYDEGFVFLHLKFGDMY